LLLDRAQRLIKHTDGRRAVTIVHGDSQVWNCFLPRDGGSDVRLFDWDTWRLGVAAEDLAYMMAVHWYPDRRRLMERPLLDAQGGQRLRPARFGRQLPFVRAGAHRDAGLSSRRQHSDRHLVQQFRAYPHGRRRPGLPRTARVRA
jgi:aminoglycoside phosphotransferase (APT) family kinase protein